MLAVQLSYPGLFRNDAETKPVPDKRLNAACAQKLWREIKAGRRARYASRSFI